MIYIETRYLVLIDRTQQHNEARGGGGNNLESRARRHEQSLVLLCVDFYDVTSFDATVRLCMDGLDALDISVIWVLLKGIFISDMFNEGKSSVNNDKNNNNKW